MPRIAAFSQRTAVASQKVISPGDTVLVLVVTAAVRVTIVPLVTVPDVPEESVRAVVVGVPKAKLSGVDTVASRRANAVKKMPEKERTPDFEASELLLRLMLCDDMLISVTTRDVTGSFQADGCALRRSIGGWWPLFGFCAAFLLRTS